MEPRPFEGFSPVWPDYGGGGIVNLMSSIIAARGGVPEHATLRELPPAELTAGNLVLMVIDGLGHEFLQRHPQSFLHRHLRTRITSVFPSTTASAITSFLTGLTPAQHGLTGWFMYLRELGSVAATLPFRPRHGGPGYSRSGIDARRIFDWTPIFDRIAGPAHVVSAQSILDSEYSLATGGRATRNGYRSLDAFFSETRTLLEHADDSCFVYAYWPELDSMAHRHGVGSAVVEQHFLDLDRRMEAFAAVARQTGTQVLVCADHGHIDTAPDRVVALEDHPVLAETLLLPLCGEPRVAYCYVRPTKRRQFEDYVADRLADCCDCLPAEQLLAQNLFGPGRPHPRLNDRIGDYALLMTDNYVCKDRLLGEHPFDQIGVHGGASPDEMWVPLILFGG